MTGPETGAAISVVIPTLGRPILSQCLEAVAGGAVMPARVIVVDQGASAAVARLCEAMRARGLSCDHLPSSQRGKAAALNRGLEQVTTGYAAIVDDDCLVRQDWLQRMVARLAEHPGAIVTGPAYPAGAQPPVAAVTLETPRVTRRPSLQFDLFCGSNMAAAMTVMRAVGGFDEHPCFVGAAEDCDWAYRALRAAVPIVYAPDVAVDHVGWRGPGERADRYRRYARSHGSFYGKHLRRGDPVIVARVLLHHLRAFKRWGSGVVTGNREQMLNGRAYLTGLLPGIVDGFRRGV